MGKFRDNLILAAILTASSAIIYLLQLVIFRRPSETGFYFLQDLAFVPVQALIVTLVINKVLNINEKRRKIKKVNVIISTFFVDAGVDIMMGMLRFNRNCAEVNEMIKIEEILKNKENIVKKKVSNFKFDFYADPDGLDQLASTMTDYRGFLLALLENSNLLEHESFTDMLWAVFHVADELKSRGDMRTLPKEVIDHLSYDMKRAYTAMVIEWVKYIIYLRDEYPFLFQTAIKKNPFLQSV